MLFYKAYGLTIRSDIELPALPQVGGPVYDIDFRAGPVTPGDGGETKFRNWEASEGRFLAHFYNVCRVLVTGGDSVVYDRLPGNDDSQIVSVLLGTCLAAILMQRRVLPIHSCCVLTERGAVLVMGPSGAGKSTTLGGLLELGLPMLADDVTGLTLDAHGRPIAVPAFPAIRLWQDSLDRLGHVSTGLPRVRSDMEKFYLPASSFHNQPEPIRGIVRLAPSNGEHLRIEPIDTADQVETLSRFIFRKNFIDGMKLRRFAFEHVASTVNAVTMLKAVRPAGGIEPRELASRVLAAMDEFEDSAARQALSPA